MKLENIMLTDVSQTWLTCVILCNSIYMGYQERIGNFTEAESSKLPGAGEGRERGVIV